MQLCATFACYISYLWQQANRLEGETGQISRASRPRQRGQAI